MDRRLEPPFPLPKSEASASLPHRDAQELVRNSLVEVQHTNSGERPICARFYLRRCAGIEKRKGLAWLGGYPRMHLRHKSILTNNVHSMASCPRWQKKKDTARFCFVLCSNGTFLRWAFGVSAQLANGGTGHQADPRLVARAGHGPIAGQRRPCNAQGWLHIYYMQLREHLCF